MLWFRIVTENPCAFGHQNQHNRQGPCSHYNLPIDARMRCFDLLYGYAEAIVLPSGESLATLQPRHIAGLSDSTHWCGTKGVISPRNGTPSFVLRRSGFQLP